MRCDGFTLPVMEKSMIPDPEHRVARAASKHLAAESLSRDFLRNSFQPIPEPSGTINQIAFEGKHKSADLIRITHDFCATINSACGKPAKISEFIYGKRNSA